MSARQPPSGGDDGADGRADDVGRRRPADTHAPDDGADGAGTPVGAGPGGTADGVRGSGAGTDDRPTAISERLAGLVRAFVGRAAALRDLPPRAQGVAVVLASVVLLLGSVLAWDRLDLRLDEMRPGPLLAVGLLLVPATILLNVVELRVIARLLATPLSTRECLRVVLVATAAAFLPLPGAAVTRVAALTARGAGVGAATSANVLAAVTWVGGGTLVAALAAAGLGAAVALPLAVVGLAAAAVGVVGSSRLRGATRGAVGALAAVELGTALLHAARLWLVADGLARPMAAAQALVTGATGPLAAAAGVVPSGIGLAEGLGAAIGATVELAPAVAFAAIAANRVLGIVATVPVALAVGVGGLRGRAAT